MGLYKNKIILLTQNFLKEFLTVRSRRESIVTHIYTNEQSGTYISQVSTN